MKLVPIIKPIGRAIVLSISKLTFLLFELFCNPTINIKNKEELNKKVNNIFLKGNNLFYCIS